MRKLIAIFSLVLSCSAGFSQGSIIALANVPREYRDKVNLVKTSEDIYFEVTDVDRAIYKERKVFTILNEKAKDELLFRLYASKFRTVEDVEIKIFDAFGKQIERYRKKDFEMFSMGEGLIDDTKRLYLGIKAAAYPVTVEYYYHEKMKGTMFFPQYVLMGTDEYVVNSQFTAKVPREFDIRYKQINTNITPEIKEEKDYKLYSWKVSNLNPIAYEEGGGNFQNKLPRIVFGPTRFKMDDYEGDMSSWKTFGAWTQQLYNGKDKLNPAREQFFRDLVKNAGSDREKVKLVYDYLQENFRYVSIQLGIGGWQPLPASFTDEKKYGDCKGLSNYTYAALKAVGIKSHPALIYRGYEGDPVHPDFTRSYFNHVILCVPLEKDTVWIECTNRNTDFGTLDYGTLNKYALLLTDQGGVLVSTPRANHKENMLSVRNEVEVQPDGSGKVKTNMTTAGYFKDLFLDYFLIQKTDEQKDMLVGYFGFKQPDEFDISKTGTKAEKPMVTTIDMHVTKVPEFIAGSKIFLAPRINRISVSKLPATKNRVSDYYFTTCFTKTDSTCYKLPAGYRPEALPQFKSLSCEYASYATNYRFDQASGVLYSVATLELKQSRIPASDYEKVKQFFDAVVADDSQRIVMKKD